MQVVGCARIPSSTWGICHQLSGNSTTDKLRGCHKSWSEPLPLCLTATSVNLPRVSLACQVVLLVCLRASCGPCEAAYCKSLLLVCSLPQVLLRRLRVHCREGVQRGCSVGSGSLQHQDTCSAVFISYLFLPSSLSLSQPSTSHFAQDDPGPPGRRSAPVCFEWLCSHPISPSVSRVDSTTSFLILLLLPLLLFLRLPGP